MAPRRLDLLALSAQRHTLLPANALDTFSPKLTQLAFFSARPLDSIVLVPWLRESIALLLVLTFAAHTSSLVASSTRGAIPRFSHYRFTSLEQRDGRDATVPGIAEFGLMRMGEMAKGEAEAPRKNVNWPCKAHESSEWTLAADGDGASITLSLASAEGNGFGMWYIVTAREPGTEDTDPVRFLLEGSNDRQTWTTVGSSSFAYFYAKLFFMHGYAQTPERRGGILVLDASMPWRHGLYYLWLSVPLFVIAFGSMVFAVAGWGVKASVVTNLGIQSAGSVVCAFALFGGVGVDAGHALATSVVFGGAAIWLALLVDWLELVPVVVGLSHLVIQMSLHQHVTGSSMSLEAEAGLIPWGVLWALLGMAMLWWRLDMVRTAVVEVSKAKAAYREAWERVLNSQRADVAALERTVELVQRIAEPRQAKQVTRKVEKTEPPRPAPTGIRRWLSFSSPGSAVFEIPRGTWGFLADNVLQSERLHNMMLDYSRLTGLPLGDSRNTTSPVKSLDQLHAQACLVSEIFTQYVASLSLKHDGKFRVKSAVKDDGEVKFRKWQWGPISRHALKLGGIKSVVRCKHKLELVYGNDVSRLLDLVREMIYFDKVADLDSCLRALAKDDTLEIVRVKSSMCSAGEGTAEDLSAGMQFVSVILRLVANEEARSLCVDSHCCELLLVLTDIAEVQTREMHQAYLSWRICKRFVEQLHRRGMAGLLRRSKHLNQSSEGIGQVTNENEGESPWGKVPGTGKIEGVATRQGSARLDTTGPLAVDPPRGSSASLETLDRDKGRQDATIGSGMQKVGKAPPAPTDDIAFYPEAEGSVIVSVSDVSDRADTLAVSSDAGSLRPLLGPPLSVAKIESANNGSLAPLDQYSVPELCQAPDAPELNPEPVIARSSKAYSALSFADSDSRYEDSVPELPQAPLLNPHQFNAPSSNAASSLTFADSDSLASYPGIPEGVPTNSSGLPGPSPKGTASAGMSLLQRNSSGASTDPRTVSMLGASADSDELLSKSQNAESSERDSPKSAVGSWGAAPNPVSFKASRGITRKPIVASPSTALASGAQEMAVISEEARVTDESKVQAWLNGAAGNATFYFDGGETSWGVALSAEMEELIEGLCRMSALGISSFFDKRFESVLQNKDFRFDNSGLGAAVFSTRPMSSLLTKRFAQIGLVIIGYFLIDVGRGAYGEHLAHSSLQNPAKGPFEHYRLETLLTRNGTDWRALTEPVVSDFGIIGRSRCSPAGTVLPDDLPPTPNTSLAGSEIIITYPGGTPMWGFYFKTSESQGSEPLDPAHYRVWGTNDPLQMVNGSCPVREKEDKPWQRLAWRGFERWKSFCGARWYEVGGPLWNYGGPSGFWAWNAVVPPQGLPTARGADGLRSYLLHPPWYHYLLYWSFTNLVCGGCLVLGAVVAAFLLPYRKYIWFPAPYLFVVFGFVSSCLMSALHAVLTYADGAPSLAFESGTAAVPVFFLCLAVLLQGFNSMVPVMCLWLHGSFDSVRVVMMERYLFDNSAHYWTFNAQITLCSGTALFVAVCYGRIRAKVMLWADERKYDACWRRLVDSPDNQVLIQSIAEVVKELESKIDHNTPCRQLNHLRRGESPSLAAGVQDDDDDRHPLLVEFRIEMVPGVKDPSSPVTSFNQLYCQAAIATLLLMEHVKDWANTCNGMFPERHASSDRPSFAPWSDISRDADRAAQCMAYTCRLKKNARCIEKLLRVYRNDVSQLVDVARCCIVFASLHDLLGCLAAIAADSDVAVERVKNRLSPGYDSSETSGYRDVCLNLRITSSQARALGSDLHVCEVQLQLLSFAELKTDGGHARYIRARNLRGA